MVDRRPVTAIANATASSAKYAAVTPSDTDLPWLTRAIYVRDEGATIVLRDEDGVDVPFVGLAVGIPHPLVAKQIRATGSSGITTVNVLY